MFINIKCRGFIMKAFDKCKEDKEQSSECREKNV